MRPVRVVGMMLAVLTLICGSGSGGQKLGIRDLYHVNFVAPVRVGTAVLRPGDYTVRQTMEGEGYIMLFQKLGSRAPAVKAKCSLGEVGAERDTTVCVLNAANERVLEELIFRGDTAKHVF